ncbi:MAG: AraC family transcriptional regulator [Bacteroidota bacterium]
MLKNFERVIQALKAEFVDARHGHIKQSYNVTNEEIIQNRIIWVYQDSITIQVENSSIVMKSGDIVFLSAGTIANISYQGHYLLHTNNKIPNYIHQPMEFIDHSMAQNNPNKSFSYIDIGVRAHGAIDFFRFLGLAPFVIKNNFKVAELLKIIFNELSNNQVGQSLILHSIVSYVIVEILRYVLSPHLTDRAIYDKLLVKIDALMDLRLVKIFKYINENIAGDLSNVVIAQQVRLNKDYIGQFFTKHTHMNLQTYVQMVRLNKALEMLKSTELKIQEISKAVGFRDFAYFCKQFRILFGNSPKRLQKKFIASL